MRSKASSSTGMYALARLLRARRKIPKKERVVSYSSTVAWLLPTGLDDHLNDRYLSAFQKARKILTSSAFSTPVHPTT